MPDAAIELPASIAVGFFPKITQPGHVLGADFPAAEICSVSHCISPAPPDWIMRWRHNELGFYDSEEAAYEIIDSNLAAYDLYAYRVVPIRCRDGVIEPLTITRGAGPIPDRYDRLGWDVVTKSSSDFFECSPLSCNGAARQFEVNRYCLFDDVAKATAAMLTICSGGGYEPGPYHLFEVYRARNRRVG